MKKKQHKVSEDNNVEPPKKHSRLNEDNLNNSDDFINIGNLSINEKGYIFTYFLYLFKFEFIFNLFYR